MKNILIFGNSGSGKSTLAKQYANKYSLAHLDLDTLAWLATTPPKRMPFADSLKEIDAFTSSNRSWVIEGCYADLITHLLPLTNKLIFINSSVECCIKNCQSRPWEPHKYPTKEVQDSNLAMLIDWVRQYPNRDDETSLSAHQKIFNGFTGDKIEYQSNQRETLNEL